MSLVYGPLLKCSHKMNLKWYCSGSIGLIFICLFTFEKNFKLDSKIFDSLRPSEYAQVQHTNIASDNCLSPVWCQAIIRTDAAILSITPYGTYFSEILFKIQKFPFTKMHLKISSAKCRPFCLSLKVLTLLDVQPHILRHECHRSTYWTY